MGSTPQRKFYVCSVSLETKPLLTLCDWVQVPCLTFNWCSLVADYYWVLLSCPKWISWWGMEKWVIPFSLCLREFIISFLYFHSFILIIWAVYLTRDKPLFVIVYSRGVCLVCSICYWKYFFPYNICGSWFPLPQFPPDPPHCSTHSIPCLLYSLMICMFSHEEFLFFQQFWLQKSDQRPTPGLSSLGQTVFSPVSWAVLEHCSGAYFLGILLF